MPFLRLLKKLVLVFFLSTILVVCIYRLVPVYLTPLMAIRTVQQLTSGKPITLRHSWVPLEKISPHLARAVVAAEDNRFMDHYGFDFTQIKKALAENKHRRKPRGASTISQQTAKNVFLWPQPSLIRKAFEAYFTMAIELIWGKRRIMEVYLNSIEMGDGIYGAEAVARLHFAKSAAKLTAGESALIAATLPNPLRYNSARPSPYLERRKAQIRQLMNRIGRIDLNSKSSAPDR